MHLSYARMYFFWVHFMRGKIGSDDCAYGHKVIGHFSIEKNCLQKLSKNLLYHLGETIDHG